MGADLVAGGLARRFPLLPGSGLATTRLRLRALSLDDAVALHAIISDPVVCRFTPDLPSPSLAATMAYAARCVSDAAAMGVLTVALAPLHDPGRLSGFVQVGNAAAGAELGFALARAVWGNGLMAEALRALTAWMSSQRCTRTVSAWCDGENHAVARLLERTGFKVNGVHLRHRIHPALGPHPRDCIRYARVLGVRLS